MCMKTWLKISFKVFAHANFKFMLGKPPKHRLKASYMLVYRLVLVKIGMHIMKNTMPQN